MSQDACTFYIVRHGEAELNKNKVVMGQLDSNLTVTGQTEASTLHRGLNDIPFDLVLSSDLRRAYDTARIIVGPEIAITVTKALRERSFGALEGHPQQDLEAIRVQAQSQTPEQRWRHHLAADIESDSDVYARVYDYLTDIAKNNAGKTVLVVTHSGPIRTLLVGLGIYNYVDLPPGSIGHGQYGVLTIEGSQASLKGMYPEQLAAKTTE